MIKIAMELPTSLTELTDHAIAVTVFCKAPGLKEITSD